MPKPTPPLVLSQANGKGLNDALQRISGYLAKGEWLPVGNRYAGNAAIAAKGGLPATDAGLEDYLASSVPIHCLDGWSYLARSLEAQLSGDSSRSTHLAYYAELRAAMALLGSQGIGVLDLNNFVIEANGAITPLSHDGTHKFAWLALQGWGGTTAAADLLGRSLSLGRSTSLADWLTATGLAASSVALADRWFRAWGADLAVFAKDRAIRNQFSYSPTSLFVSPEPDPADLEQELADFWSLFDPIGGSPFNNLDRYLVRSALRDSYLGAHGGFQNFATVIDQAIASLSIDDPAGVIREFLTGPDAHPPIHRDPWLLQQIGNPPGADVRRSVPGLLGRATLLLRIATGAARELVNAGAWSGKLDFWLRRFQSDAGLWSGDIDSMFDARADIGASLNEISQWRASNGVAGDSKSDWHRRHSLQLRQLAAAQLVGLWGLSA